MISLKLYERKYKMNFGVKVAIFVLFMSIAMTRIIQGKDWRLAVFLFGIGLILVVVKKFSKK